MPNCQPSAVWVEIRVDKDRSVKVPRVDASEVKGTIPPSLTFIAVIERTKIDPPVEKGNTGRAVCEVAHCGEKPTTI